MATEEFLRKIINYFAIKMKIHPIKFVGYQQAVYR